MHSEHQCLMQNLWIFGVTPVMLHDGWMSNSGCLNHRVWQLDAGYKFHRIILFIMHYPGAAMASSGHQIYMKSYAVSMHKEVVIHWTVYRAALVVTDRLTDWLIDWSIDWFNDWSINEQTAQQTDRQTETDRWMNGWTSRWRDRWMDGQTDKWMDGWKDGWKDGWMGHLGQVLFLLLC